MRFFDFCQYFFTDLADDLAGRGEILGQGARQVIDDLRSALANLGFKGAEVEQAVGTLQQRAADGEQLEALLPEALRLLRG